MKESFLRINKAISKRLFGVPGEGGLFDDELVQVVTQEISTGTAAMPVVDAKERALRPVLVGPTWRLQNVENDAHTVFVVVPHQPLVRIGGVGAHYSVSLERAFRRLMVWNYNLLSWLERQRWSRAFLL